MSIIETKLNLIKDIKEDIKEAIEEKGIDMESVAFEDYASKIKNLPTEEVEHPYIAYATKQYYETDNLNKLYLAWGEMEAADPAEIERDGADGQYYGSAQYPNYATNGIIIPEGIERVGDWAFGDADNNYPLVLPETLEEVGIGSFYRWESNNQPLVLPKNLKKVSLAAFATWKANNHPLVIPEGIEELGESAFGSWHSNDKQLILPEGLITIGDATFNNWPANTHPIIIPSTVERIMLNAFRGWLSTPYVKIYAVTPPQLDDVMAFDYQNNVNIYVPDGSYNTYRSATNWSALSSRIKKLSAIGG